MVMAAMPVIGAVVGALLSSHLSKLYGAVGNLEDRRRVEELDQELRHINCRIEEIVKNWKDMSVSQEALVERMRLLVYDIEDLVDSTDLLDRLKLSRRIKQISGLVAALHEHLKNFKDEEPKPSKDQEGTSGASTSTSPALGDAGNCAPKDQEEFRPQHLQGMEERAKDVQDLVQVGTTSKKKKPKVISIVGFGGMGKSLLAREVYNCVQEEYPIRSFVQVGRRDEEKVLKEIETEIRRTKEKLLKQPDKNLNGIETEIRKTKEKVLQQPDKKLNGIETEIPRTKKKLLKQPDKKLNGIETEIPRTKEKLLKQPDKRLNGISQSDDGKSSGQGKANLAGQKVSDGADVGSTSSSQPPRADEKEPRYFVVIDDVMEEQLGKRIISVLESNFPVQDGWMTVAVTVLLTTSVLSVAKGCKSDHVYMMRPLSVADSESLFKDVARLEEPITEDEEELMKEIRMKCEGLPLALVSVAKFCGTNIDRWKEAWRKLGCPKEEDYDLARMQRVLAHSYTSLSSHPRQASLLYFSMFPHGHPVRKGSIIRRWLAEGAEVDCRTTRDQMEDAKQCFETLVGRNVIWPHQDDVKTWKPHGFMLEYIKGMSELLKFIMLSCLDNDNPEHIRRLSLHNTGLYDGGRVLNKNLSRLRTLAVFRKTGDRANLCFKKCKMLRLLDLEACNGLNDTHLDEICKELHLLKYLSLGASINWIGRDIMHLKRLETLDLGKQAVVTVPVEVIMLPELKHLLGKLKLLTNYGPIRSDTKSSKVRKCLEESKLETLAGFVISKSKGFPQLMGRLKNLKKVKIWCDPSVSPRNVEDVVASIRKFLARGESLNASSSLSIDFQESTVPILDKLVAGGDPPRKGSWWRGSRTSRQANGAPSRQNPLLGCLASLKLKGFAQLSTTPAFLSNLSFIHELCLSSRVLTWKDLLEGVSNLKTLQYLKVEVMGEDDAVVEVKGKDNGVAEVDDGAAEVMGEDEAVVEVKGKDNGVAEVDDGAAEFMGEDDAVVEVKGKDNGVAEVDDRVAEVEGEDDGEDNIVVVMQKGQMGRLKRMCLVANRKLPSFQIEDGALESLISLHLTSQHLVGQDSFKITFLKKLKEVALQYRDGSSDKKEEWKQVARKHPNTPQVIVIQTEAPQSRGRSPGSGIE